MDHGESSLPAHLRIRARGAGSNRSGRYEAESRSPFHDGWDIAEEEAPLRTEVRVERPRSAITRNASPDISFDRSINPFRGCEHGCIYCFARPSHAWLGLSPGLDFETRLVVRPEIGEVLARELARPAYRPGVIAIGTNTDPYQPVEATTRAMRGVLEVLAAHNHPVGIVTRGTLVERDIDLLAPMAEKRLVRVGVSVTTLDAGLARLMEPRAPAPQRRLEVIRRLSAAGIPVRVMAAPMIPALTDHELEAILAAARGAGATTASTIPLRLPREVAELFREWTRTHVPDRAARIIGRVRDLHGGRDYDPQWGRRMKGQGPWAELLAARFRVACERLGYRRDEPPLRTDLFRVPPKRGDQLELF